MAATQPYIYWLRFAEYIESINKDSKTSVEEIRLEYEEFKKKDTQKLDIFDKFMCYIIQHRHGNVRKLLKTFYNSVRGKTETEDRKEDSTAKNDNDNTRIPKNYKNLIKYDNLEEFQSLLSMDYAGIEDQPQYQSDIQRFLFSSAYYGSVRCFKYLLLNIDNIDISIVLSAVKGGNLEIIRILAQKDLNFSRTIYSCIRAHNNYLVDWIIENYEDNNTVLPSDCAKFYNLHGFFYFLYTQKDIEDNLITKHITLLCNVINNDIDLLRLVLDQYHFHDSLLYRENPYDSGTVGVVYKKSINLDIVKYLVEKGADLNYIVLDSDDVPEHIISYLLKSVENGDNINVLKYLIEKGLGFSPDKLLPTKYFYSLDHVFLQEYAFKNPLEAYFSIENPKLETVKLLVQNGTQINLCTEYLTKSQKYYCISMASVLAKNTKVDKEIWNYLIDQGLNISEPTKVYQNNCGYTVSPLTIAIQEKNYEIAKLLIEKGADINSLNEYTPTYGGIFKETAFYILCSQDPDSDMIPYFIEHGADLNLGNFLPITLIITEDFQKYLNLTQLLIKRGANLNKPSLFKCYDVLGQYSPFVYPIEKIITSTPVNFELLKLFVENGANVNTARNFMNPIDIELSKSKPNQAVINYLYHNGAVRANVSIS